MISFVNLTPHTINIHSNGNVTNLAPSGNIARVSTNYQHSNTVSGINIYGCVYGDIDGLPDSQDNTIYIVSGVVKSAVPDRLDVMSPGELIRNNDGKPIGCNGLRQ
jgi:hypothetical protein